MVIPQSIPWDLPEPVQVDRDLLSAFAGNPVFAEVLHRRGFRSLHEAMTFLDDTHYTPADPFDFRDMGAAVELALRHIHAGSRIAVCGDYDTDGLTATAILYEGLTRLSPRVQFFVPDRNKSYHGINTATVHEMHALGIALMITCDTGVSENEAVALARSLGMDVIITDHHAQPEQTAPANAVINPVCLPKEHPFSNLSGAGVAYELLRAIYRLAGIEESCSEFLDLAAVGLVSDLVPLIGEARWMVQRGIKALQSGQRPGLSEMLRCADLVPEQVTEKTISHLIAPRISSLCRMYDGGLVIDLLTTHDENRASTLASLAEQANISRKQLTDTILMAAVATVENDRSLLDKPLLYLENSQWHYSVLGLVANQLVERYHRPAVIVSSYDAVTARGSARSVPGMDIMAVIAANADHLDRYGGHAMAAGFSVQKERLPDFRRALMATAGRLTGANAQEQEKIVADAFLPLWEVARPGFVELLQKFQPHGSGNPPLQFLAENLIFVESVPFGKNQNHRRLSCSTQKLSRHSLIWWNSADLPFPPEQFDLVYQVTTARANRPAETQIQVVAIRPHARTGANHISKTPTIEVTDWREAAKSMETVWKRLAAHPYTVFSEGIESLPEHITVQNRYEVKRCEELVLLSCPASYEVLREILRKATPQRIFVIGMQAALDQKTILMQTITEFILTAIRTNNGRVDVQTLAAKTGQPERNIRLAIGWLVKKTTLRVREKTGTEMILDRLGSPSSAEPHALEDLERALEETLAFKRFFQRAELSSLFLNLESETE